MFTAGSIVTPGNPEDTAARKLTVTVSLAGWGEVTGREREYGSCSKEPTFVG